MNIIKVPILIAFLIIPHKLMTQHKPSPDFDRKVETATKSAQRFYNYYIGLITEKIQPAYWTEFYGGNGNMAFDRLIIISEPTNSTLIVLQHATNQASKLEQAFEAGIYPTAALQEINHKITFSIPIRADLDGMIVEPNIYVYISGIRFRGLVPIVVKEDAFVFAFDTGITTMSPKMKDSLVSNLSGMNFLIGSTDVGERFDKRFKQAADDLFEYEFRNNYVKSELFRQALTHPLFKQIASMIKSREDMARNKVKEYPFWEFNKDLDRMRAIAKRHNLNKNFVDDFMKTADQYAPSSGILIKYYDSLSGFMLQWTLINTFLFLLCLIVAIFSPEHKLFIGALCFAVCGVNGYVISQKPSALHMGYWILPMLIFLLSYFVLFFRQILDRNG